MGSLLGKEPRDGKKSQRKELGATYIDQHSDLDQASDMLVDAWFDYWIGIKKQTVRLHTVRNYSERYMNLYVHITEDEKHREIDLVADALKVV